MYRIKKARKAAEAAARAVLADSTPGIEDAARVTAIWAARQILKAAGYEQTAESVARGMVARIQMEGWK